MIPNAASVMQSSTSNTWLLVLGVVLLIAVVAFVAYFMYRRSRYLSGRKRVSQQLLEGRAGYAE